MPFDFHRLITPTAWAQVGTTYWSYDRMLNDLLDSNPKVMVGYCTTTLISQGKVYEIWTANYPFAYGGLYGDSSILPSVKTRKRLRKYILENDSRFAFRP